MKRNPALLAIVGVTLALPLAWSWSTTKVDDATRGDTSATASESAASPSPLALRNAEHQRFGVAPSRFVEHALSFTLDESAAAFAAFGGETRATVTLEGRLRLDGLPAANDSVSTMRLSMSAIDTLSVLVNGQELVDDIARTAFASGAVVVDFDSHGAPVALAPEPGAHTLFVRVAQLLVSHGSWRIGTGVGRAMLDAGESFVVEEEIPDGALRATYRVTARDGAHIEMTRDAHPVKTRVPGVDLASAPPSVSGHDRATLRETGVVVARDTDVERILRASDGATRAKTSLRLTLALVDEGASTATVSRGPVSLAPANLVRDDARAAAVALEQRIEGLTRDALVETTKGALVSGTAPDHNRFLWRATALIRKDHDAVDAVASLFAAREITDDGRALVLDLLVGAGTPRAQEALLALLERDEVARSGRVHELRQRLTFVSRPTEATLAFLDARARADDAWQEPARMSLGAAASHLASAGRDEDADRVARTLLALPTKDARAALVLVKALGNTGRPVVEDRLVRAATSDDPDLRHAAAGALRHLESPRARETLLALMTDRSPLIASRAMASMAKQPPLDERERSALAELVFARRVPDLALMELVTLLAPLVDDALVRDMLRSILTIERIEDPNIKARVRMLLEPYGL